MAEQQDAHRRRFARIKLGPGALDQLDELYVREYTAAGYKRILPLAESSRSTEIRIDREGLDFLVSIVDQTGPLPVSTVVHLIQLRARK